MDIGFWDGEVRLSVPWEQILLTEPEPEQLGHYSTDDDTDADRNPLWLGVYNLALLFIS